MTNAELIFGSCAACKTGCEEGARLLGELLGLREEGKTWKS
jgi:hypothetical protein